MLKKVLFLCLISILLFPIYIFLFKEKETIKIGMIADLSGKNSDVGVAARNGLRLAVEEINKSNGIEGHKVELIIKNHGGLVDNCLERTKELVSEGVKVIIGPIISSMSEPVIKGVSGSDVLVISPTVSTDDTIGIDDNFFRISAPASLQGKLIGELAIKRGNKNVVIIIDNKNYSYGKSVLKGLSEVIGVEAVIKYSDVLEFYYIRLQLEKIKPDAIVFVANGIDSSELIQLYSKNNRIPQLYGVSWVKASEIHKFGGKTVEGMILIDTFLDFESNEQREKFLNQYYHKFNIPAKSIAMYFYDSLMLYALGVKKSKGFDTVKVKQAIIDTKNIKGLAEDYSLDKFGDGVRGLQFYIIKNNKYELLRLDS